MSKSTSAASKKVEKSIHEMKKGNLKTGSGKKVTSRKQAIAIGLSEAREAGADVPPPPTKKTGSKSAQKSTISKSSTSKKK